MLTLSDGVTQHGTESHFVRPDRVYATGVRTAIPGFQPVSNAQGVAMRFTQPQYFTNRAPLSGLAGLALAGIPLWQRVRLRIQSAIAQAKAKRLMRQAGMAGYGLGMAFQSNTSVPAGYASLPAATESTYGIGPADANRMNVGLQITAGLPPNTRGPSIVETYQQAGQRVAPNYFQHQQQIASMPAAGGYMSPYVAMQQAMRGGWQR